MSFSIQFKTLFGIKILCIEIMIMATLKLHVRHSILIDNTEADFTFVLSQILKEINIYGLFQHFLQSEKFLVKNSFIKLSEKKSVLVQL